MHSERSARHDAAGALRSRIGRTAAVAAVALALLPASAQADVIRGEFTEIVTSLGTLTDRVLLAPPDAPATMEGEFNPADNTFVVAPENFRQPPSRLFEGALGIQVQVEFAPNGPVTGTFDPATGAMTLNVDSRVTTNLSGPLTESCSIPSFQQTLTTDGSYGTPPAEPVKTAAPFAPPSGEGALVSTWPALPPATEGDATCQTLVNGVAGTAPGGTRFAGRVLVAASAADLPPITTPVTGGPGGGDVERALGGAPREHPTSLTTNVRSRAKRAPFRYSLRGELGLPDGIRPADGCAGIVGVQIKAAGMTISERRTRVQPDCTWRSDVAFGDRRRFAGRRRLKAIVRFNGNQVLLPERVPAVRLRVG